MIYSIVGTDIKIRDKALRELGSKFGKPTHELYTEHIDELEPLIDASDLFGGVVIVGLASLLSNSSTKERLLTFLPKMKKSENVFIIDEPFLDSPTITKLNKTSEVMYDAREEKKKDTSVFVLCLLIAKRDKKGAWLSYSKVKHKEEGEKIAGAIWWKWKEVWGDTIEGKKTAYTLSECEMLGKMFASVSLDAHRGRGDIYELIESAILSL